MGRKIDRLFRGCLYGSVFGDACGAPFEMKHNIPLTRVLEFFNRRLSGEKHDTLRYTDDSEMALCICDSMKRMSGFNPTDMARTFSDAFDVAPSCRLYGGSIGSLFSRMKASSFMDPFEISSQQFKGSGSYGNGGGMRITPVSLFGFKLKNEDFNTLVCQVTALTHTNPLALYGALLQAHAIRRVLTLASTNSGEGDIVACTIDAAELVDDLYNDLESADLSAFAFGRLPTFYKSALQQYRAKLGKVKQFVTQESFPEVSEVVAELGNSEYAIEAIPTALYVFLQCQKPMPQIPYESLIMKCSIYATLLGFDTDTIGCMACAIAGALVGAEKIEDSSSPGDSQIPGAIFGRVEGLDIINEYCDWLIQHYNANGDQK